MCRVSTTYLRSDHIMHVPNANAHVLFAHSCLARSGRECQGQVQYARYDEELFNKARQSAQEMAASEKSL